MSRTLEMGMKSMLNRLLGEAVRSPVPVEAHMVRMGVQDPEILAYMHQCLAQWEAKGFLRLVTSPQTAAPEDVCVEMLYYIDGDGWPNWRREFIKKG